MDTNYSEQEKQIVVAGIDEIAKVLLGDDIPAKERLLFFWIGIWILIIKMIFQK